MSQKDADQEDRKQLPAGNDIKLNNVHFGYKDQEVLHGVDIEIKEGTVNALVGPSGSGKSTIAKLIASFWDTDKGSVTYSGGVFGAVDYYLATNAFVQTATHVDIEESQHDRNRSMDAQLIMAEGLTSLASFTTSSTLVISRGIMPSPWNTSVFTSSYSAPVSSLPMALPNCSLF